MTHRHSSVSCGETKLSHKVHPSKMAITVGVERRASLANSLPPIASAVTKKAMVPSLSTSQVPPSRRDFLQKSASAQYLRSSQKGFHTLIEHVDEYECIMAACDNDEVSM
jgi:hypothetical protein